MMNLKMMRKVHIYHANRLEMTYYIGTQGWNLLLNPPVTKKKESG